jgi:hypothetical protein
MALNGATIKTGITAMTPTGGSTVTFTSDGVTIPNGLHVSDASQADIRIRKNITFKNKPEQLGSDGVWTKARRSITIVAPKTLASTKSNFPLIRIEVESHPENTAAERLDLAMMGADALSNAAIAAFLASGSLA